ncbi:MAG: alpha/beta hydrolase [Ignavibacteriae bacterium]|nr:MAG: alpha/beta hydrolase [Ignavibacteriota bacterium]
MKKLFLLLLIIFSISNFSYSQQQIDGSWAGKIEIMGMSLEVAVRFTTGTDSISGIMDIPMQGAKDITLSNVSYNHPNLHFEMPGGLRTAVFDGNFAGDTVKGTMKQSGMEGTFFLSRGELKSENENPHVELLPYNQEEVTFTNGENTFAGTLTTPLIKGKHPAVIMITGSGAQNRDEEIFGFKIFRLIADNFTRNGIAVLRYDDRGIGGSKGKSVNESTTQEFAEDVVQAVKYLQTREDINSDQIGLCGHSEGGIIAPLAATMNNDIAFIVLIAGTSVKGMDIIREQTIMIMKANNASQEDIDMQLNLYDKLYNAIKTDTGWDELKEEIRKAILKDMKGETDSAKAKNEEMSAQIAEMQIQGMRAPWFKFFADYDPYPALTKVKCPVLALFGEFDLQVLPAQNKEPMEEALGKSGTKDYKIIVIPTANHLFQSATTGSPEEYGSLPKEFVPGFLDSMTGWILERVTIVK